MEQLSELSGSHNFKDIPYRSMKNKMFTYSFEDRILFTHDSNFIQQKFTDGTPQVLIQ